MQNVTFGEKLTYERFAERPETMPPAVSPTSFNKETSGQHLFIGMNASYLIVFCIFEGLKQASAPTVVDKEDVMNKSYRSKLYKNVQIALLQGNSILG